MRFLERHLPVPFKEGNDKECHRAQIILGMALLSLLLVVLTGTIRTALGHYLLLLPLVLMTALIGASLLALFRYHNLFWAGHILVAGIFVVLSITNISHAGKLPTPLLTLCFYPMLVVMIVGRRGGMIWGFLSVGLVIAATQISASAWIPWVTPTPQQITRSWQIGAPFLCLIVWGVSIIYETFKSQMIAQYEKARADATEANRAKSLFLTQMSHELRTPLNAIIGYAELLQEEHKFLESEEIEQDLNKIRYAGKHLLGLINEILDLARLEAGKTKVEQVPFSLEELVAEVTALLEPTIQKNQNTLQLALAPALGVMISDPGKIKQNLLNLLSNASKFNPGSQIALEVERTTNSTQRWITFRVRDQGQGIPADQLHTLFEPFSQLKQKKSTEEMGTGLGLAIVHQFCLLLGGHIEAESTLGEGTCFTMHLPDQTLPTLTSGATAQTDSHAESLDALPTTR